MQISSKFNVKFFTSFNKIPQLTQKLRIFYRKSPTNKFLSYSYELFKNKLTNFDKFLTFSQFFDKFTPIKISRSFSRLYFS